MFCIAAELLRPDAPQASGLDHQTDGVRGDIIRDAVGEWRRQGQLADAGMREMGARTRDSEERKGGQCPPGKRRKRRARRAEPHDEAGCAVRKLRVERRIKNGLRMLTQAAVSPQRRCTISASSGKQIPVPRQDAGSDARGSCARSAQWRPSDDRCIHGRACRTRLLFCRCGGDSRS